MTKNSRPLKKVFFDFENDEWHGHASESLWAEHIHGNKFKIRNSPFFVKGVSFEDIVAAKEVDAKLIFERVLISAGNSTYRLLVKTENIPNPFLEHWKHLEKLGCSYEKNDEMTMRMFAVDVPSASDIYAVYELLEEGKRAAVWDFEEGHCGHVLNGKGSESV